MSPTCFAYFFGSLLIALTTAIGWSVIRIIQSTAYDIHDDDKGKWLDYDQIVESRLKRRREEIRKLKDWPKVKVVK